MGKLFVKPAKKNLNPIISKRLGLGKQLQLGDGIVLNVQGVHKRNVKILMIE